jgi:hypothetical protein
MILSTSERWIRRRKEGNLEQKAFGEKYLGRRSCESRREEKRRVVNTLISMWKVGNFLFLYSTYAET